MNTRKENSKLSSIDKLSSSKFDDERKYIAEQLIPKINDTSYIIMSELIKIFRDYANISDENQSDENIRNAILDIANDPYHIRYVKKKNAKYQILDDNNLHNVKVLYGIHFDKDKYNKLCSEKSLEKIAASTPNSKDEFLHFMNTLIDDIKPIGNTVSHYLTLD